MVNIGRIEEVYYAYQPTIPLFGVALIVAEITIGNFVLLLFGIAAFVVGIVFPLSLPTTGGLACYLFAVPSVVLLFGLRSRMRKITVGDVITSSLNEDFVGRSAAVKSGCEDQTSERERLTYGGINWDATSRKTYLQTRAVLSIIG